MYKVDGAGFSSGSTRIKLGFGVRFKAVGRGGKNANSGRIVSALQLVTS